jgi:hypothetical protein
MRRIDPLHIVSAVIVVVALVVIVVTSSGPRSTSERTASVHDAGSGGAGSLRRYLELMGARTRALEGSSFDPQGDVLLMLGAFEVVTDGDVARLRTYVQRGFTLVLAVEFGIFERPILDAYGIRIGGVAAPGTHALTNAAFADPPAQRIAIDRGLTFALPPSAEVLATDGQAPIAAAVRDGRGVFIAVGSLWPFVGGGLAQGDNARVVLAFARRALAGGTVAFDEYHHGVHPTTDITVLLERTWPGRALAFAGVVVLLYLVLSGRRLGRPIPLEVRPARSSLEYIRGFAGLVRRSGRGEIARRRLRRDLRRQLARRVGLDPDVPFERVIAALGASDRERAARAMAIDDALARPLREDQLLRTVREMEQLVAVPA